MRIVKLIERFNVALSAFSGISILVITLLIVIDVALRTVLGQPVRGATEASTLLMVAVVFFSLAGVQATKANFRVEILVDMLSERWRRRLAFLTTLVAFVAITAFSWLTATEAWTSLLRREMSFGVVTFPIYPARLIIAFGLLLLAIQLFLDLVRLSLGAGVEASKVASR